MFVVVYRNEENKIKEFTSELSDIEVYLINFAIQDELFLFDSMPKLCLCKKIKLNVVIDPHLKGIVMRKLYEHYLD